MSDDKEVAIVLLGGIAASGGVVKNSPGITRGGFGGKSSSSGG